MTVEKFAAAYYADRTETIPWSGGQESGRSEENRQKRYTVPWRYAILITHEIVARVIPHLDEEDLKRFHRHFKGVFIDDYATVPLMSIRRLLALSRAGKLSILKLGEHYEIRTAEEGLERGAEVEVDGEVHRFGAFIDATGQDTLSATDLPFPTLVAQGGVLKSATPKAVAILHSDRDPDIVRTGGIDVDEILPSTAWPDVGRAALLRSNCLSPHKEPFVQGITSARDIGETVGRAILNDLATEQPPLFRSRHKPDHRHGMSDAAAQCSVEHLHGFFQSIKAGGPFACAASVFTGFFQKLKISHFAAKHAGIQLFAQSHPHRPLAILTG